MNQELLKKARFEIRLKSKGIVRLEIKDVSYHTAKVMLEAMCEEFPEFKSDYDSEHGEFGFKGHSVGQEYDYHVSAGIPRVKTAERQRCGRRDDFMRVNGASDVELPDYWDRIGEDRVCSYCGSMHPEDFLALIAKEGPKVIGKTDKSYKFYVERGLPNAGFGAIKFYVQHFTPEQINRYNNLVINRIIE